MIGYAIEYWPGTTSVKFLQAVADESQVPDGWGFVPEGAILPTPVPGPIEAEANEVANLNAKQRQANAQVTAIQGRVDSINDAIEFDEALPEEIAELPARTAQLKLWKKYRIDLGRVTSIPGWYETPTYPLTPEPYTTETSRAT